MLEGQEQIHLHKKSVLRNPLLKYHQLMISSPWTVFSGLFCQWLERMSPCRQWMLIKTPPLPKSCSGLLPISVVTNNEGHPDYQMTLKVSGLEWRNQNSNPVLHFLSSSLLSTQPAKHSPSSDSFQVTPPLSLYQSTYDEWLDRQSSRWLGIQTDKWEYMDPYLHPIQCIISCSVVSSLISKGFRLALPGRWSKYSSFKASLW